MSSFPVQRIALCVKIPQPLPRIGHLQQRPADIVAQPTEDLIGRRPQVDDVRTLAKVWCFALLLKKQTVVCQVVYKILWK